MKFFIYSRKSVYTGKGESIENQIEMCRQYIHTKYSNAVESDISIYEDEGFSAKNTDRPQFQQMLRDMKLKNPEYVVCYRLDRISRNVSDFSSLIEDLNERSISFVCIKEEFDTSKPMGKAMMYIASVFAQLERETIAERVRDNMLMLARTGRWLGGTTPTGYTSEKIQEIVIDGKTNTSCRLKDSPDELRTVDIIYEKFLELHSISAVSRHLIREGVKSRNGVYYSLPGIKQILQNPVYCIADKEAYGYFTQNNADVCFQETECSNKLGILAYNKRDYKKKNAPRQSKDKWIIAIGRHKGRLTGKKWVAVQNSIEQNKPTGKTPAKMHNDYSLLSGFIYCGTCGSRMFAKSRTGRRSDSDAFDYMCSNKLRGGTKLCACQNLGGRKTDDLVCQYLIKYIEGNPNIYKLLEKLKQGLQRQEIKNPVTVIEARIKRCNDEMDNLIDSLSRKNLGAAFVQRINARVTELDSECAELVKQRSSLQKEADSIQNEGEIERMAVTLSDVKGCFQNLSVIEKRILVRQFAGKIVWDGYELHIYLG